MTLPEPFSRPLTDDPTVLVALTVSELDALIIVLDFELVETPDDFWHDETRAALSRALEKFRTAAG